MSRIATNLVRAESPSKAVQKPVRHGAQTQSCAELSSKENPQNKISNASGKNQIYANPPTGDWNANLTAMRGDVTTGSAAATSSNGAARVLGNWADYTEDPSPGADEDFTVIKSRKRRRNSADSPTAAKHYSNPRGAGAIPRPRSSTGWVPRVEEIKTTRAHIAEARARQASSAEDNCVCVEYSPELEPYHYIRAVDRIIGGTNNVYQVSKINGHYLMGLNNRGLAERLISEGLEVEGTLFRAFPFRKRAMKITVGNLPFFVEDSTIISALTPYGRVTSIAPKLMNDGRRDAFIVLHEGVTTERLPEIKIKGELVERQPLSRKQYYGAKRRLTISDHIFQKISEIESFYRSMERFILESGQASIRWKLNFCGQISKSWPEVIPLKNIKADTLAQANYERWISRFGMPSTIITDCAKKFSSTFFQNLAFLCGIKIQHTTPYHPQSNEKLSDKNYLIWANRIESELRGLKLWRRIIEGKEIEKPQETDKKFNEKVKIWDDDNAIARNVMNRTMNDTQILKYSSERSAKRLWYSIKEEMASKNEDMQMKNRIELSKLRMKEDETVDDYLNRAVIIKSKSIQAGDEIKDRELICFVLEGLRIEFDFDVKIIKSDKEKNMNKIRQILKETEEKLKHRKEEKRQTEIASKAREGWSERRKFIKCYNCGKIGHISKECRNKIKCFKCGGFGHISEICKKYRNECHAKSIILMGLRVLNRQNNSESTNHMIETNGINYEEEDQGEEKIRWTMDSGASSHMVSKKELFIEYKEEERIIATAEKGAMMKSSGIGSIRMKSNVNERFIKFENVLHIPNLRENLLSVTKIIDHDFNVLFSKNKAEAIDKNGEILYEAKRVGDKFEVEGILNMEIARKTEVDDMLWHQRLAHVNFQKLKEMYDNSTVFGLKNLHNIKGNCESCTLGKLHRKSYKSIQYKQSENILDLWHTDIVGPLNESFGYKYFITIVDDYSNFTFVIPIANKSQTADSIINLITQEERQTGKKLKRIRNDNGGEYVSNYFKRWLSSKGIKQEFTTAYTPESNGKAERLNRTIVESARTMLINSKLPKKFWSESVKVAVHVDNRIKIKEMNTTPFEIYKGWKPNIVYLKRFGSEAYVHIRKEKRKKMEPKAHKGIMMGYSMIRKGYRIYLPEMDEIHEVSGVKFNEAKLGYYLMNNSGRNLDESELFLFNREDQVENFSIDDEHIPQDDNDVDLSEIEEIPPDEIITPHRRGPEPGMTREMRNERDLRLRETEEEELIKRGVRRSERLRLMKNKENVSDRTYEIKRPKDYQEALNSEEMKADHLTKTMDAVKIKNCISGGVIFEE
ncbi:hypothetical protein LAZ67_8002150 [Cordylochernes scorpioides]|uniref:Uncharacterized protein n=1 Tax=Cordylochernes scorpioides TaxID=51811 RepID=A0ABY6KQS1_9ARAC|nr:hypothetical protein LAZ67_8002150 [Cordylochernes scorpioides]